MSDQHPDPTVPQPTTQPTTQPTGDPEQPLRGSRWRRWRTAARERAGRVRTGVALAVAAALLLGGAGGFAIGAFAADGGPGGPSGPNGPGGRHDHSGNHERGLPAGGPGGERQGPPPGVPGQLPPATSEDEPDRQG